MLKLKYLFENFDLARKCVGLYDFDESSLDEMLDDFRISSNAVYPFRSGSDPREVRFLRLSPKEEKSLDEVMSEVRLICWLNERGFPAMKPVPMKNGRLADAIATEWGEYNVSCFECVEGDDLEDVGFTPEIARGYGRSLGRLHALLKEYPAANERGDYADMMNTAEARMKLYGAPDFMLTELESVRAELSALPKTKDNFGIVHFDYEPDNVFYDSETGVYSAIDFDDAMRCWFALDIQRALDAMDEMTDEPDSGAASAEFLAGYREACALTDFDESTIPLMRRLVLIKKYTTLLHVMSEATQDEPDWLVELKEKLNGRLRWVESTVKERE